MKNITIIPVEAPSHVVSVSVFDQEDARDAVFAAAVKLVQAYAEDSVRMPGETVEMEVIHTVQAVLENLIPFRFTITVDKKD